MTNFDDLLNGHDIKSEPEIWIQKLVVYRDISKPPIQTIEFRKGLNIVRAGDDSVRDEITGHGTGKTTLCRFIRYVFGEQTYSNKSDRILIKEVFKNGCVAAEIHILGKRFIVRRPFDDAVSYVLEEGSIEDIISSPPVGIPKNQYVERLNLHSICDSLTFRNGKKVQWGHLLTWMARDQESRLSSIYDWRDSESDSASPAFQNPKADPLFLMRAILDLLAPDEIFNEKELHGLAGEIEKKTKEVESLRIAPSLNIKKSEEDLFTVLKSEGVCFDDGKELMWEKEEGLIDDSLSTLSLEHQKAITIEINGLKKKKKEVNDEIESFIKSIGVQERALSQAQSVKALLIRAKNNSCRNESKDGTAEQSPQATEPPKPKDDISCLGDVRCEYGRRLVSECTYFLDLLPDASYVPDATTGTPLPQNEKEKSNSIFDSHVLEQNIARFEHDIELQQQCINRITEEISQLKKKKESKKTEYRQLDKKITGKKITLSSVQLLHGHVVSWRKKLVEYKELQEAEDALKSMQDRQRELHESLDRSLENHQRNTCVFTEVFDKTVKAILRDTAYSGQVLLNSDRELAFDIFYGKSSSKSVAINVLKTILADISSLIYSAIMRRAVFPRLLIHDSPREADLQIVHYNRIFEMLVLIQNVFEDSGNSPFQYIITTTTEPTNIEAKYFPMPVLDARDPQRMFLKCRLDDEFKRIKESTPLIDSAE